LVVFFDRACDTFANIVVKYVNTVKEKYYVFCPF